MTSALICKFMLIFVSFITISTQTESGNSTILSMRIPEDTEPVGGLDKIVYSFLGEDRAILNEYIQIVNEIFSADIFKEHLQFLKDIRLKCLPRLYFRLRKIKPSDFTHCQKLHSSLIDTFGNRILEACRRSDSFLKCLGEAKKNLSEKYEEIEEDIVELYLNEIMGGKNTCMGDIIRLLKSFNDLVQKECR